MALAVAVASRELSVKEWASFQRAYLAQLDERLNAATAWVLMGGSGCAVFLLGNPMDDTRALVWGVLKSLSTLLGTKATALPQPHS